ncbi:MAG: T9SS type A sorting domain-containing protein, partial [Bacteroidota bacterium]
TLNALNNTSEMAEITGVIPDENGEALITITNTPNALFSYVGAIVIEASNQIIVDPTFARSAEGITIDEINTPMVISAYPNPIQTGQRLKLDISSPDAQEDFEIEIYNAMGRLVYFKELTTSNHDSTIALDLDEINIPGVYLLKLTNGNGKHTFRIIKD